MTFDRDFALNLARQIGHDRVAEGVLRDYLAEHGVGLLFTEGYEIVQEQAFESRGRYWVTRGKSEYQMLGFYPDPDAPPLLGQKGVIAEAPVYLPAEACWAVARHVWMQSYCDGKVTAVAADFIRPAEDPS